MISVIISKVITAAVITIDWDDLGFSFQPTAYEDIQQVSNLQ